MLIPEQIVADCAGYGTVLRAWEGARGITSPARLMVHRPLSMDDARRFTLAVHVLLRTIRPITVYRFYETGSLSTLHGKEPCPVSGTVRHRVPAEMLGGWWSPRRPSLMIDGLGVSSDHRQQDHRDIVVNKEWYEFDTCVEATLAPNSLVYAGRTAPQAEGRSFETDHGRTIFAPGGAAQFLLVRGHSSVQLDREYHFR